jgi:ribonucleoside-diphosphate reductase beta chain
MSLLTKSIAYKPFRFPWAFDYWQKHEQIHWLPEEVPLAEDVRQWNTELSAHDRNLLTQIFRFFTQADHEVSDCYNSRYSQIFQPTEVKMMLTSFSNRESVHMAAYSLLLDTIGIPEAEYSAFLDYEEMKDKHDYLQCFNVDTPEDVLLTMACFGAFTEGLQLFASFAMLLNFQRFNKMKGMGQIVTWSVRDESLHCEGIIRLFHEYARETGAYTDALKWRIRGECEKVVMLEDRFVDLAFELGPVEGMTAHDIKQYIRYVADWRLSQLGLAPLYGIKDHPIPWLIPILNGVEHANFFEARATEYSKGATTGDWVETWGRFDQRLTGQ